MTPHGMEHLATLFDGLTGFFLIMFFGGFMINNEPFVPAIVIGIMTHLTARFINTYAKMKKDEYK